VTAATIGPNAVVQLGEALRAEGLDDLARAIFTAAGHREWLAAAPRSMLAEREVARLHDALWALAPQALPLAREAGRRTADYILANRIPRAARWLLAVLPSSMAEPLLVHAIARHAWTFAGSGRFVIEQGRPSRFAVTANPLARAAEDGHCFWHEAVFTRLWQRLIDPRAQVVETRCGHGVGACRFEVRR